MTYFANTGCSRPFTFWTNGIPETDERYITREVSDQTVTLKDGTQVSEEQAKAVVWALHDAQARKLSYIKEFAKKCENSEFPNANLQEEIDFFEYLNFIPVDKIKAVVRNAIEKINNEEKIVDPRMNSKNLKPIEWGPNWVIIEKIGMHFGVDEFSVVLAINALKNAALKSTNVVIELLNKVKSRSYILKDEDAKIIDDLKLLHLHNLSTLIEGVVKVKEKNVEIIDPRNNQVIFSGQIEKKNVSNVDSVALKAPANNLTPAMRKEANKEAPGISETSSSTNTKTSSMKEEEVKDAQNFSHPLSDLTITPLKKPIPPLPLENDNVVQKDLNALSSITTLVPPTTSTQVSTVISDSSKEPSSANNLTSSEKKNMDVQIDKKLPIQQKKKKNHHPHKK